MRGQAFMSMIKMLLGWASTTILWIFLYDAVNESVTVCISAGGGGVDVCNLILIVWKIYPLLNIVFWGMWATMQSQKTEYDSNILP